MRPNTVPFSLRLCRVLIKPVREESLKEMLLLARTRSGLAMPATTPSVSRGVLATGSMSISASGVGTVVEERS